MRIDRSAPGKAQDHQLFGRDAHFDRFTFFIGAVVDRIHQRLFDGPDGKVPEPFGFRLVRVLDHRFFQVVPLDVTDRLAEG